MDVLRTPPARFAELPGFPWSPVFIDDLPGYESLRVAVIDEGPKDAPWTFLCLHGEPTWSYLYRKMIPVFLEAGARVVAPDFLGFGQSDKPAEEAVYGFHFHRNLLLRLVERLDLRGVALVAQDWGGLIGLTLPVDQAFRARLAGLVVMNTALAVGEPLTPGFDAWRAYAGGQADLNVGALMKRAVPGLTDGEAAAYDAPFPDRRYKAGVHAFPKRVMTSPDMEGIAQSRAAATFWSQTWDGPSFMACGGGDMVFPPDHMQRLRAQIRGCPEPMIVPQAGHFIQEWGEPIAERALMTLAGFAA